MADMRTVTLRNGSEEFAPLIQGLSMAVAGLTEREPLAFYEAVMVARNPKHEPFGGLGKVLRDMAWISQDGTMRDSIRNYLLSSAEGEGLEMVQVNPVVA